jgi:hypothetical protein
LATSARLGNPRAGRPATDRHARTPALAVEMHENGPEAHWYLNTDDLREHEEEAVRMAACWSSFALGDCAGRCPERPTIAIMTHFAEHSGHS